MSQEKKMLECDMCHKQVKEATTFICQHSFCGSCLTDDIKICNADSCPKCSAKCQEDSKKHIDSTVNLCGYCEKEEGGFFCEECDQSWCSTCSEIHKKMKLTKNHRIVQIKLEKLKPKTTNRFYCVECENVFEKDEVISHKSHKIESETEFIKEKISGWKDEINKIKAYEVLEKSHMRKCEKKLKDKKRKILIKKDKVRNNYQELMEVLKGKEALEYERIDEDLSRMQREFLEHQRKTEKNILFLQETRSNIEVKLKEINNRLPDDFKNDSPFEQPQMNPHPTFEPHFFFQPIPIEALKSLPPCVVPIEKSLKDLPVGILPNEKALTTLIPIIVPAEKYCIGKYEADEEKKLNMHNVYKYFQIDNNFIYAYSCDRKTLLIYSLETFQLIKTLPISNEIDYYPLHILKVEESFYIIGYASRFNNMLTFDEKGVKLHDFTLPSHFRRFSKGETGKVFIICKKYVISYDPVIKKQETINADVNFPIYCCSLGSGDYCMRVLLEGKPKLVKVVNGGIVKVADVLVSFLSSNDSGMVCGVDDDNVAIMHVMDRNLNKIFKFEINFSGAIEQLNMDDAGNINIRSNIIESSIFDSSFQYCVKKYKMIPK